MIELSFNKNMTPGQNFLRMAVEIQEEKMERRYTNLLLDLVEDGSLDKDHVINAFVKYMSEDDVQDMMEHNNFIEPDQLG
jgi:hypothetical protein